MLMPPINKWIESLDADGRVSDAARVSLEARLSAVTYWLPLAARQLDDDVEKVHQLRVATRRAIASLRLYENSLPKRAAKWLARQLKKIRRAAGNARDLDVFADWLRGQQATSLLVRVNQERSAAQPEILAIAEKCERDNRFRRQTYRLLAGIRPRGRVAKKQDVSFRNWAETRLNRAAERFFAALPHQSTDLSALHQFRIRGKQLRYALELLAPAFGPELRKKQYPVVEQLQELLGRINDCVAGDAQLRRWRRKSDSQDEQELLGKLISQRRLELDEAIAEFRAWWTTERIESLRQGLLAQSSSTSVQGNACEDGRESQSEATEPASPVAES